MENEITKIVEQAISEDWLNTMTTSDLQGTCDACAMGIYNKNNIDKPRDSKRKLLETMKISEKILKGIYDQIN